MWSRYRFNDFTRLKQLSPCIIHMSLYVLSHITAWTQGRPLLPALGNSGRFLTIPLSHTASATSQSSANHWAQITPKYTINKFLGCRVYCSTYWCSAPSHHSTYAITALPHSSLNFHALSPVWTQTTDKQGRSQNLHHFYPSMGLKLGVFFGVFSTIKITVVRQVRMSQHLLRSEHEDKYL